MSESLSAVTLPVRPRTGPLAPGNTAVWILIYAELTEFAFFFLAFLIAKAHHPELFAAGPGQLHTGAGLINTFILLTSSYTAARAVAATQAGRHRECGRWLLATIGAGAGYCVVKTLEYYWNDAQGLHSRDNLFFSLYYYLTFNHLLHVLMGMVVLSWAFLRNRFGSYSAANHEGLESAVCYWHMIDLAWIVMFPLLYVLR